MNTVRSLASIALLVALVPSSTWAQAFTPVRVLGESLLGPAGQPVPPVTRCFAGELTGDARRDALILVDGDVHMVWGAGGYESLPRVATGVTDLALVRRGGVRGGDAFATVGAAGLRLHRFEASIPAFVASPLGGVNWAGATRVRGVDLDVVGDAEDLLGIAAGGGTVLLVRDVLGTTPLATSFASPDPALDACAVDWLGTSARELAVARAGSIGIHRPTGLIVASIPLAGPLRAWTTLRGVAAGHERLALVVSTGGEDVLQIVAHGAAPTSHALGSQGVRWIGSADLDHDGDEDLVLTREVSGLALVLPQLADGSFDDASAVEIDLGAGAAPAGITAAGIACGDFDDDGDVDLLAPVPALGGLSHLVHGAVTADRRRPVVGAERFVLDHVGSSTRLELDLRAPDQPLPGATHVELTVWRVVDAETGPGHAAIARILVPATGWPLSADVAFEDLPAAELIHAVEAREVVLDTGGDIVSASSPAYVAFSASLSVLEAFAAHVGLAYAAVVMLVPFVELPPPVPDSSRLDTGIVPMGDVPKFEDDPEEIPDPKPGD